MIVIMIVIITVDQLDDNNIYNYSCDDNNGSNRNTDEAEEHNAFSELQ